MFSCSLYYAVFYCCACLMSECYVTSTSIPRNPLPQCRHSLSVGETVKMETHMALNQYIQDRLCLLSFCMQYDVKVLSLSVIPKYGAKKTYIVKGN